MTISHVLIVSGLFCITINAPLIIEIIICVPKLLIVSFNFATQSFMNLRAYHIEQKFERGSILTKYMTENILMDGHCELSPYTCKCCYTSKLFDRLNLTV